MKYARILAAVAATPWAIESHAGRQLAAILSRRVAGEKVTDAELEVAAGIRAERQQRKNRPRANTVALIPLHGVMTQRADLFMEVSGMLSTEQVGQLVDQAADDPTVDAIVMDVDSPGGSVFGTAELAAKVAAAAKKKKVIAVANSMAASAAYFVASQASELVVTPSGMVGSIGVVMMHVDETEALKMQGLAVTVVASSEKKAAGVDPGAMTPAWKGELESLVAGYYTQFVKAVADGRRVSQKTVKEDFGDGGVLLADAAVRVGMADKVSSLDEILGRYGVTAAELAPAAKSDAHDVEFRRRKLQMD